MIRYLAVLLLVVGVGSALAAENAPPAKVKVIIITGVDHPAHNWRETAPALKKLLEADPRLAVDVTEDPKFLASPKLADYDVAVIHFMPWDAPDPGDAARQGLQKFVSSGKGLVVLHFGCGAFYQWPEYEKMIGRVYDPKLPPHDPRGPFKVQILNKEHPIIAGLHSFGTDDELYTCLRGEKEVNPLATARSKVTGEDEPMALTTEYGKGRVFLTTLGHDVKALAPQTLHIMLQRACLWSSGSSLAQVYRDKTYEIRRKDKLVLEYRALEVPYKPYVSQLFTPGGVNVLRDSPADHKHHHGLMFAIKINDVNYWEEVEGNGRQNQDRCSRPLAPHGRLWWEGKGDTIVAEERRTIDAHELPGCTLVTWTTRLLPFDESITLGGNHYHGLGMRFPESLDKSKPHFLTFDGDDLGQVVRGTERLGKGKWFAVQGTIDGKPVTIAMFDHPKNARPALFFTMTDPFAYLSATINLWKQPITLNQGESVKLTYGVAAWDGHLDRAAIEQVYQQWLKLVEPAK